MENLWANSDAAGSSRANRATSDLMAKSRLSRRRFIASVATTGLATQLPSSLVAADAAAPVTPPTPSADGAINADTLAAAEKIASIQFTAAQREPLVKIVSDRA